MRRTQVKLSVALTTYNEEKNLERCLESVKNIADEIIIIDGSSNDQTVAIAKKFEAKVTVRENPPIFHVNKQMALDQSKGEWILQLDADEVVSPELAKEIELVINSSSQELETRIVRGPSRFLPVPGRTKYLFGRHQSLLEKRDSTLGEKEGEISAFFIPRSNFFMGSLLKHGGVYPDGVIRLVKNGKARFPCKSVHEQIEINGRVEWLENNLIHFDSPTFSRYLIRSNRYTALTASEFDKTKVKINIFNSLKYFIWKPFGVSFMMYLRHRGYVDGFPGFVFALFSGLHFPVSYIKLWEKQKESKGAN